MAQRTAADHPHVVIVGAGFGGLTAAQALRGAPVRVTVIDRTNHHLFQPLLYQVAIAGLSPAEIASPIRSILRNARNTRVLLGNVTGVDLARKTLTLDDGEIAYDYLILATGAKTNYFGHDEWERYAPGLKSIEDAIEIRRRVLLAFELAERTTDPARRAQLLTFVSIGGGATGVELAGAIAELARHTLARDFRSINPAEARVVLLEAGPRILPSYDESLSAEAVRELNELGVEVRTGGRVTCVDASGVTLDGTEVIPAATVLWGAGVKATTLGATLGVPLDRGGRVIVEPDVSLPGHPDVFAIGDMASYSHDGGKPLPGVSQTAMQQARFVARQIMLSVRGGRRERFTYVDLGNMATIGRSRAIAEIGGRVKLTGFVAWLAWLFIHLMNLVGYRNRFVVLIQWMISYVTYRRGARLITGDTRGLAATPKAPALPAAPHSRGSAEATPARTAADGPRA